MLAVFTESIDCDNGCDCIGFGPIWPTWSILLFGVDDCGFVVTVEFELIAFTPTDVVGTNEDCEVEFDTWLKDGDADELKVVDELIDCSCCCCCCWEVAI